MLQTRRAHSAVGFLHKPTESAETQLDQKALD